MSRIRTFKLSLGLALMAALPLQTGYAQAPPPPDPRGSDLFIAIRTHDDKTLQKLLDAGVNPNFHNWVGMAPLMFAAAMGNEAAVKQLLAHHAALNEGSLYGNALTFAVEGNQVEVARFLLSRGVDVNPSRGDNMTPLMIAAGNGSLTMMNLLLTRKPDVNAKDNDGMTALMNAARNGHSAAVQLLLSRGVRVNEADSHGWNALMYASANGHAEVAQRLLSRRANVNAKDSQGHTPLILAAHYSSQPDTLRVLMARGAKVNLKDKRGKTALSYAMARGSADSIGLLREKKAICPVTPGLNPKIKIAAVYGLSILQQSIATFSKRAQCTSCHHQGLGLMAMGAAREKGLPIQDNLALAQMKKIHKEMIEDPGPFYQKALTDKETEKQIPGIDMDEFNPGMSYMLAGLIGGGHKPDAPLAVATQLLAQQQTDAGNWSFTLPRVPIQSSVFTITALAIQALKTYAPADRQAETQARINRARTWLLRTPAVTTEDKAMRLLALKWAGATTEERKSALAELRKEQRPDGGWSQLPSLHSDGYATGQALYALIRGGDVSTSDVSYRRGSQFLLKTQDEDGSWFVNKRAMPVNIYIDGGFPHGESQYASFGATCWATMALLQSLPDRTGQPLPSSAKAVPTKAASALAER